MTQQPDWDVVGCVGDASPLIYGGGFVYVDKTGVYCPEVELIEAPEETETVCLNEKDLPDEDAEDFDPDAPKVEPIYDERGKWTVYRFLLEDCTYIDGILSDNKYHPQLSAWFAGTEAKRKERPQDSTYLNDIADFCGMSCEDLVALFISADPMERAFAWMKVGDYHGYENLDSYPLEFTSLKEMRERYKEDVENLQKKFGRGHVHL